MKRDPEADVYNALPGVTNALYRAAHRARAIAASTRTPLVFSRDGHIEKLWIEREAVRGDREEFERYLIAVPDAEPESDRLK